MLRMSTEETRRVGQEANEKAASKGNAQRLTHRLQLGADGCGVRDWPSTLPKAALGPRGFVVHDADGSSGPLRAGERERAQAWTPGWRRSGVNVAGWTVAARR